MNKKTREAFERIRNAIDEECLPEKMPRREYVHLEMIQDCIRDEEAAEG